MRDSPDESLAADRLSVTDTPSGGSSLGYARPTHLEDGAGDMWVFNGVGCGPGEVVPAFDRSPTLVHATVVRQISNADPSGKWIRTPRVRPTVMSRASRTFSPYDASETQKRPLKSVAAFGQTSVLKSPRSSSMFVIELKTPKVPWFFLPT